MIYSREEASVDYENYRFGYAHWGVPENDHDISLLYEQGYLPYSGNQKPLPMYYLCRSLRVSLAEFKVSSENRRVMRKVLEAEIMPVKKIISGKDAASGESLITFFLEYFIEHHGPAVMSRERLLSILNYSPHVSVSVFSQGEEMVGAVISQEFGDVSHYWFSAYSSKYPNIPLGMWLMLTFVQDSATAFSSGFVYLGTGYGQKALYKANIEQAEYFDGNEWQRNHAILKELMRKGY